MYITHLFFNPFFLFFLGYNNFSLHFSVMGDIRHMSPNHGELRLCLIQLLPKLEGSKEATIFYHKRPSIFLLSILFNFFTGAFKGS